ncbi:MAG: hypothetical protein O2898_01935, partial [Proteobacteria bacterium]|nr:hypothetical protein [Pseudomonadota bacterium]
MAKDFAEINRLYDEAGVQATEVSSKDTLVNKFVKAWENQTARRAAKGGGAMTMALTLAACGGGSDAPAPAPVTPVDNLIDFVSNGITAISGADPIVVIPNETPGADNLTTTIGAGGSGTLELRFADAEDTVTLAAASDLSGYTTLAITAGTVDVTAVNLAGIATISVSSGVVLTAEQFLGLTNGVVGGSTASTVTIEISTAAQAQAVIDAVTGLSGTFAVGGLTFVAAAGSGITAAQAAALSVDLEAALEAAIQAAQDAADAAELAAALPAAIQAIEAASADAEAFVETAMANENVALADAAADTFEAVDAAIDAALLAVQAEINSGLPGGFTAFDGENAAVVAEDFADAVTAATTTLTTATTELDAIDPQLQVLVDAVIAAEDADAAAIAANFAAAAAVDTAIATAEGNDLSPAVLTWNEVAGTLESDATVIGALSVSGVLTLNANLVADAVAGTYTVGGATYNIANIQAVVSAAQAELAAIDAVVAASAATGDAVAALGAAFVAQGAGEGAAITAAMNYYEAVRTLEAIEADQSAFEAGVAEYNAVLALDDQATALEAAVDAAFAALQNAPDFDPAGLGIQLVDSTSVGDPAVDAVRFDAGGAASEIYAYDAADGVPTDTVGSTITLTNFGGNAADYVYMGAGVYTFVEMTEGQTLGNNLGSASVLVPAGCPPHGAAGSGRGPSGKHAD